MGSCKGTNLNKLRNETSATVGYSNMGDLGFQGSPLTPSYNLLEHANITNIRDCFLIKFYVEISHIINAS